MRNQDLNPLINKKLDNEISGEEQLYLDAALEKDRNARKSFEDLKNLEAAISQDAREEKQVDLREGVMDRIDFQRYPVKTKPNIFQEFLRNLTLYPEYRIGVAGSLVFGLLIGIIALSIIFRNVNTSSSNNDNLVGTLSDRVAGNMQTGSQVAFDNGTVKLNCSTKFSPQNVVAEVEIISTDLVKANFQFNPDNVELYGLRFPEMGGELYSQTGYDFFQVTSKGDNKFLVLFKSLNNLNDNIRIRMFQNDALIYENSLQLRNK